jgi:uncharacterized membrane protein YedE/YeeE
MEPVFGVGIVVGGFIAAILLANPAPVQINPALAHELQQYGITDYYGSAPHQLFNWQTLFSLKGFLMIVAGGFMVGFGTRYAGGCTSGHAIMGYPTCSYPH